MNDKPIDNGWQGYRALFVPDGAPPEMEEQLRQAFFAGASMLWTLLMVSMDEGDDATEGDLARMQVISDEVTAFGLDMDRRYGMRPPLNS